MNQPDDELDDLAIIGLAGRFPGARNVQEFWRNLREGVESVRFFSDEELLAAGFNSEFLNQPNCVKARAILDGVDLFDAPLFGFTPREAEITDPQHRLFLECAWEALEDAAYDPATYAGRIGVYAGSGFSGYLAVVLSNRDVFKNIGSYRTLIGNDKDFLSSLASYKLDLTGPSVVVQTACSTSLVAVHMACQSLLNGECDIALAGGVSIRLPQQSPYLFQEGGILSPDGHCRAFDADAQGTVGGEGVGLVVVKRLAEALRDRDDIRAIIKSSAINNDGSAKVGFTAPSIGGQAQVITEALELSGVDPETISYIEAHGTGTALGDPIEIAALTRAFGARTTKKGFCAIGSAKTNIGHLDAAAGVAGLIKTVLALKHQTLPPTLHLKRANPKIDFKDSPFYVQSTLSEWANESPRRAGVSSFGIGGTNAHVILEEAPPRIASGESRPLQLLVLSAKTSDALEQVTQNAADYLQEHADANLADVAYTLQVGRRALEHRRMLVCEDGNDASQALSARDAKRLLTASDKPKFRPVIFMFPGQGTQYANMTLDLYRHEPYFRELIDYCADFLQPHLNLDLRDVLYPTGQNIEDARRKLNQTRITQPALFVVEYGLAKLWIRWGIRPEAMIGHSLGEYVAACLAGVFTLEEGLALVAARGRFMGDTPDGRMLAVRLSEEALLPLLNDGLALAAVNSPSQCVVSGSPEVVAEFQKQLDEKSIRSSLLPTPHALHSQMMELILSPFARHMKGLKLKPPSIPYLSNVTGNWITASEACSPDYWARHLRQTVRFAEGVRQLLQEPEAILLEVGPGQTLGTLAAQQMDSSNGQAVLASLPAPRNGERDLASLLHTAGSLWLAGIQLDWNGFHHGAERQRMALPTYPFERKRYWMQASTNGSAASSGDAAKPSIKEQAPQIKEEQLVNELKQPEAIMSEQTTTLPATSARPNAILTMLRKIVYELTGIEAGEEDVHVNFFDMGVDSLLIVQFAQAIQDRCGLRIPYRLLFEELTTLDAVTGYLDRELPPEVLSNEPAVEATTTPPVAPEPIAQTTAPVQSVSHIIETQPAQQHFASQTSAIEQAPERAPLTTPQPAPQQGIFAAPVSRPDFAPPPAAPLAVENHNGHHDGSAMKDLYSYQLQIMSQQLDIMQRMNPSAHANGWPQHQPSASVASPPAATQVVASSSSEGREQLQQPNGNGAQRLEPPQPAPTVNRAPAQTPAQGSEQEVSLPHKPFEIKTTRGLSANQEQYLEDFTKRYVERTSQSKRIAQESRGRLADSRLSVGFSLLLKELVYPIYGQRAAGSRVWDADGNEYVDIAMGYGVNLFGNSPPFITQAVEEQLKQGVALAPQLELTGEVAALVCELTGVERVNFCNSGTEAVMGALRIARTTTRRNRIAMFTGSYHGWSDSTLVRPLSMNGQTRTLPLAPGVDPKTVEDVLVLDYGQAQSLETLKAHAHELAAVLVEPVQSRRPDLQPREFLHEVRELTARSGTALIFDEMITGFRIHPGGAQAWFGVEADIATYGKIVGGGMPIGVVAGKAAFMDAFDGGRWNFGDDTYPQADKTFFAAAFFKHPLSMAAAWAVLKHLKESGPGLQEDLNRRTAGLVKTLNDYFEQNAVPIRVVHFGSLFRFVYGRELKNTELFSYHLINKGILTWEGGNFYLSTAHTQDDVNAIIRAVMETVEEMRGGGFLPEPPDGTGGSRTRSSDVVPDAPARGGLQACAAPPNGVEGRRFDCRASPAKANQEALQTKANGQAESHQAGQERWPIVSVHPAASPFKADGDKKKTVQFSLYYFGNHEREFKQDKYDLIFKGAKFADEHGFSAVWIPERHFDSFGGFSPNPSVLAAALAKETERIHIRAGSVALPLHNPIRVAEEWSVVDNLSKGRVGISFASGWHPNDFVFAPDSYAARREVMHQGIEMVRRLWRGESLSVRGGSGDNVDVRLVPLPMQPELPYWLTIVSPKSSLKAGEMGAGFLTNFMGQTFDEVAEKVALYREAVRKHHGPQAGHVTLQLQTFLSDDLERARTKIEKPLYDYFKASFALKNTTLRPGDGQHVDLSRLSQDDLQYVFSGAYKHFVNDVGLIGTPDSCSPMVDKLIEIGVDEICCLIDFGVDIDSALESLHYTNELRKRYEQPAGPRPDPEGRANAQQDERQESIHILDSDTIHPADSQSGAQEQSAHGSVQTPRQLRKLPVTEGQKQLWALAQIDDDANSGYNESLTLDMRGPFDVEAMRRALQDIVDRHEALRITFSDDGEFQYIHPAVNAPAPLLDLSHLSESERHAELERWSAAEMSRAFNLSQGPLFRFRLARLEPEHHFLVFTYHHSIVDGRSASVFVGDLNALYKAHCLGQTPQLPTPQQFSDYLNQQAKQPRPDNTEANEAYWIKAFAGDWQPLNLPVDWPRPALQTFKRKRYTTRLGPPLSLEIMRFCKAKRCTGFLMMLAAFKVLLHKLTGQRDVIVAIATAGSAGLSENELIGFRLNPLALRSQITDDPTFSEFLSYVKGLMWDAYEHQDVSITKLYRMLKLQLQPGMLSPVTVKFHLDRGAGELDFHQLKVRISDNPSPTPIFDLTLDVNEKGDDLLFRWNYNPDLFAETTIRSWMQYFETLLQAIVAAPEGRISALPPFIKTATAQALEPSTQPSDEADGLSLTRYQQLIWAWQKLNPDAPMYNNPGVGIVRAAIEREHFQRAVAALVENSDALRTVICEHDGVPSQQVLDEIDCTIEYQDFSSRPNPDAELLRWSAERCRMPFDLGRRLFDFAFIKLSDAECGIYVSLAHLIGDARSTALMIQLLSEYYLRSLAGRLEETAALPSFQEHVEREREYLSSPQAVSSEKYWNEKLAESVEPIAFYGRLPLKRTTRVERISYDLGLERTGRLQEAAVDKNIFALSTDVSLFAVLATILCTYLHRISGSRVISLGVPFHNRRANQETIGLFMQILPLRISIDDDDSFLSLSRKVSAEFCKVLRHSQYPVGNALRKQAYDVVLNFINSPFPDEFGGAPARLEWIHSGYGNESLTVQIRKGPSENWVVEMDTHCDVFDEQQRERAVEHFVQVADNFLRDYARPLRYVEILTPPERARILEDLNRTEKEFPHQESFSSLFEAQVRKSPDSVAVTVEGQSLTYACLNARANGLAHQLINTGVGPDSVVALLARRGLDFLTAMLAIFKAGAAYLPLDPLAPRQRLAQVLTGSESRLVLVGGDCVAELSDTLGLMNADGAPQVVPLDALLSESQNETELASDALPRNLSYVIYTSGSTGVPKGAMIEQEGMLNHLFAKIHDLQLDERSAIAQTAPQSFDISVWQFLAALLVGGRVYVVDDKDCRDPSALRRAVEREGITILETVPALLRAMLDDGALSSASRPDLSSLRCLLVTGEALPPELCRRWLESNPAVPLLNAYGPTECSDDVTHHFIREPAAASAAVMPIGSPVANIQIYILDENLLPVPAGMAGELCVGGRGVGRGYLKESARTAQSFIPNPYASKHGERLYKTGDLARHLPDGTIEFLGRIDHQVKVRGYRIEPGEIETHLLQHSALKEAIVVVREVGAGDKQLIAYLVVHQSQSVTISQLRTYLEARLPEYMVPSAFVMMDALPLTANGKVERQALPLPGTERPDIDGTFVAPRTPVEESLAGIWRKTLRLEQVGVNDNFFELGGDSILAVQVAVRANQAGLRFAPMDIFEHQTIAELSEWVNSQSLEQAEPSTLSEAAEEETPAPELNMNDFKWDGQDLDKVISLISEENM